MTNDVKDRDVEFKERLWQIFVEQLELGNGR